MAVDNCTIGGWHCNSPHYGLESEPTRITNRAAESLDWNVARSSHLSDPVQSSEEEVD